MEWIPRRSSRLLIGTIAAFLAHSTLVSSTLHATSLRVVSTLHYRVETDLDPDLTEDCAKRMDAMYEEYARRFSGLAELRHPAIFHVYLFHARADYLHLVGEQYRNTGGLFVPSQNLLAAFLDGQGRDALRRTLQHEAFHQFVHEALPGDLPPWLNEGMAQIFEEGLWTGNEFWIGQAPPRRIRQLQADMKAGRITSFRALASLSPRQWAEVFTGDRLRASAQYNQAWATVYFLTHYKDAGGQEPYRERLLKMFQLLDKGKTQAEAFDGVFPDDRSVNDRFVEYIRTLQPTAEATVIERQNVLADLLAELKAHDRVPDDMSKARQALTHGGYRVRYAQGDVRWESDADVTTYFSDTTGHVFNRNELRLDPRASAPIPDVVCRCFTRFELRTRFHADGGKVEHEVVIEPAPELKKVHSTTRPGN